MASGTPPGDSSKQDCTPSSGNQLDTSTGFHPQLSFVGAPTSASPKRKTVPRKRRPVLSAGDLSFVGSSSPQKCSATTARRMFDEFVENQLAEKLADSINEAAQGLSANETQLSSLLLDNSTTATTTNERRSSDLAKSLLAPLVSQESNSLLNAVPYSNDLLDLAICKYGRHC